MQLRELAQLNGTLRENDGPRCTNCGASDHKSWLCPDKPNVTNNIVCSSCGGAGHIARDCRQKRPGMGGPPAGGNGNNGDRAKIDEEYMSLMAELGEGPPPPNEMLGGGPKRNIAYPSLFDRPIAAPRAIMGPQSMRQEQMNNVQPPWGGPPSLTSLPWGPAPPGILPPPPPPSNESGIPPLMPWLQNNNQPPPPGSALAASILPPPPPPPSTGPWGPQGVPGLDMNAFAGLPSLLAAPPPPPPSS